MEKMPTHFALGDANLALILKNGIFRTTLVPKSLLLRVVDR
jgi:hypothetical protein